jgi:hypothetical protein
MSWTVAKSASGPSQRPSRCRRTRGLRRQPAQSHHITRACIHSTLVMSIAHNVTKTRRHPAHFVRTAIIALVMGLVLLGLCALATRTSQGSSRGFPFPYSNPVSPCQNPNPLNGCGFSYSIILISLDYVFWAGVIFALVFSVELVRTRSASPPAKSNEPTSTP